MESFQIDELEYIDSGYFDMAEFEFDGSFEQQNQQRLSGDSSDWEDDEGIDMSKPKSDTSALEARNGKDVQGIQWERLNFSRDKYREMRLKQYKNYENLFRSRDELEKECKRVQKKSTFYDFQFNTQLVKSTIVHFQDMKHSLELLSSWQMSRPYPYGMRGHCLCIKGLFVACSKILKLRNLLWATSKHDVYFMQNYSVMHWSSLARRGKEVLNVVPPIVPATKHHGSAAQTISRVQVSTMQVKDNLLVAGGFQGELICKYLNQPGVAFCTKITTEENSITNAVEIHQASNGLMRIITASNDTHVRIFDAEKFALLTCTRFPWPVNNATVSPNGKLLAILGDSADCLLADAQSGKTVTSLEGHLDYSFASAWHPSGRILATGNQDRTCRLWDIRNLSKSMSVLKGNMGAIRTIKFSSDGQFMAMAEPADFVNVYDTCFDYCKAQEIDIFGEIAGISFSPDTEALFVGVADRNYGGLLEFNRRHSYHYMDSLM